MIKRLNDRNVARDCIVSVLGGLLYGSSINLFVAPNGLYMGTFAGIAQMFQALVALVFPGAALASPNMTGLYLFVMNLPLLLLAARNLSGLFVFKTVLTVILQSLAMTLVPIPSKPLLDNVIASILVGGAIAGFGAGITLRAGGSGGGSDVLGMLITKRVPGFSVGRITMLVSLIVYLYCFIRFDIEIVIYSVLFTGVYSLCLDRFHHQNIKTGVMIFTRRSDISDYILGTLHRGLTTWEGKGGHSGEPMHVYFCAISKYEVTALKRQLTQLDPEAFAVISEGVDVLGHYENHL